MYGLLWRVKGFGSVDLRRAPFTTIVSTIGLVGVGVGCTDVVRPSPPSSASTDAHLEASASDPDAGTTIFALADAGGGAAGPPEAFSDVSAISGIEQAQGFIFDYFVTGQAWGDVDGDRWPDLYLTDSTGPNRLYLNQGDGTFVPATSETLALPAHQSGGAVFVDYDNDGDKDLYVLGLGPNVLLQNDGEGGFGDVTRTAGVGDEGKGETASWGDFDEDGHLDLYVANWLCPECGPPDVPAYSQDRLYRNRGDGTFEDVSRYLGPRLLSGAGFVASFVDYDDDNDLDLYLVNDKGYPGEPLDGQPMNRNVLWRNDGAGCGGWCFREVAVEAGADARVEGMGLAVGDPDLDNDLDFFFSNTLPPVFLRNQGDGRFRDDSDEVGLWAERASWGTVFLDYDNDADEDAYLAIGVGFGGPDHNRLFENQGDGAFRDVSRGSGADDSGYSIGVASADFDRDGWVDLVVGNWNEGYALFRNNAQKRGEHHYLRVRLIGGGPINADAIGSRVYVERAPSDRQLREIKCGSSLGAGNELVAHFGLGGAKRARVEIRWPDGTSRALDDVAADQEIVVEYRP